MCYVYARKAIKRKIRVIMLASLYTVLYRLFLMMIAIGISYYPSSATPVAPPTPMSPKDIEFIDPLGLAEKFKQEGNQLAKAGRHQEAIEAFTKAIKLRPTFDVPYINRSYSYLELKQFHNAIEDCNKAIELNTKYDWAYINRGVAHAKLNKHEPALTDYKKALELNPENSLTYYDISCSMVELNNIAEACDYSGKALEKLLRKDITIGNLSNKTVA